MRYLSQSGHFLSGNPRFYLRVPGCRCVPMPDASKESEAFQAAYRAAIRLRDEGKLQNGLPPGISPDCVRELYIARRRSQERALRRGIDHTLSDDDMLDLLVAQKGRCAATRVRFSTTQSKSSKRKPNAPSIDRLDNAKGYIAGNVRIVTVIFNLARNDFHDTEVMDMARALNRNRSGDIVPT